MSRCSKFRKNGTTGEISVWFSDSMAIRMYISKMKIRFMKVTRIFWNRSLSTGLTASLLKDWSFTVVMFSCESLFNVFTWKSLSTAQSMSIFLMSLHFHFHYGTLWDKKIPNWQISEYWHMLLLCFRNYGMFSNVCYCTGQHLMKNNKNTGTLNT